MARIRRSHASARPLRPTAEAREDSRGAHFRADFPEARDIENSWFTRVRLKDNTITAERAPVNFTRVKPGETLLDEAPTA